MNVTVYLVNGFAADIVAVVNVCYDANKWLKKKGVPWQYELPPESINLAMQSMWVPTSKKFPPSVISHYSFRPPAAKVLYLYRGAGGWAGATPSSFIGGGLAMLGDWALDAFQGKSVSGLEEMSRGRYNLRNWQIGSMLHESFHMFGHNHAAGGVMEKPWKWPRVTPPNGSYKAKKRWWWPF